MSRILGSSVFLLLAVVAVYGADPPAKAQSRYTQPVAKAPSMTLEGVALPKSAPADLFNTGPKPKWIWGPDNDGRYALSRKFKVQDAKRVVMKASCDNEMSLTFNGTAVGSSSNWETAVEVDLTKHVREGENELVANVDNQGGVAAFVAKIAIESRTGKVTHVISDVDWTGVNRADQSAVKLTSRGDLGVGPWGDVFSGMTDDGGVPRGTFLLQPGFQVETLFTVPKEELGSWVCITTDPRGRIIASDQGDKGLCRITPAPLDGSGETVVERLPLEISAAQGLLFAFDSLYISVNGGRGSGLYRTKYNKADDTFGPIEKLHEFGGGGEHGPHALRLSPDGNSIYVICGNHTRPPFQVALKGNPQELGGARPDLLTATLPEGMRSRILPNWDEDLLLPRQWDANGHARGVLAPGGWIASTDPDGKNWEVFSMGYRNPYDMAFNADGELFAYDADMEWDVGAPWYRPTRVVHAASGSEFGWRSGTGKWPTYYLDSLPPLVDIGPGSPVGVEFGYGTKFPAKYQKALYICDWTFGTMYAIHIQPDGSSYSAVKEEFVSRTPLPLTDATVGHDGALYFTIGGRGTQSELLRVTYAGRESTAPVDARDTAQAAARSARVKLEQLHNRNHLAALSNSPEAALQAFNAARDALAHKDRWMRYAARVGLEQNAWFWSGDSRYELFPAGQPVDSILNGVVLVARAGLADKRDRAVQALLQLEWGTLDERQRLDFVRALSLVLIRLGALDESVQAQLVAKLDPHFPSDAIDLNQELVQVLTFLNAPAVVSKTIALLEQPSGRKDADLGAVLNRNAGYGSAIKSMLANQPDKPRIAYAFALRNAKVGWTPAARKVYFTFLDEAKNWSGGNSYRKFIQNIDDDAYLNASDTDRLIIEATGARKPYQAPELPKPVGPGRDYTLAEVRALAAKGLTGRDFKNGEKMFAATRCILCHRFAGDGGATGPDLTQLAGRFNVDALTEALIEPSKVISDQYKAHVIAMKDGTVHTGRIVSETPKQFTVVTDPENSTKVVDLARDEIEALKTSDVSLMPAGLLKPLNEAEVLDLLAYLLSRGNPGDAVFKK